MATWGNVGCRFDAGGNLEFFQKTTGTTIFELDGSTTSGPAVIANLTFSVTRTDLDAQNGTITAAAIAGRLLVHTSVTGGGTLTFDTAANIIAAIPALSVLGQAWEFRIVNDGDQTVTLANDAGPSVTISDTGQTIAANESATVWLVNTGAGALAAHVFGA